MSIGTSAPGLFDGTGRRAVCRMCATAKKRNEIQFGQSAFGCTTAGRLYSLSMIPLTEINWSSQKRFYGLFLVYFRTQKQFFVRKVTGAVKNSRF